MCRLLKDYTASDGTVVPAGTPVRIRSSNSAGTNHSVVTAGGPCKAIINVAAADLDRPPEPPPLSPPPLPSSPDLRPLRADQAERAQADAIETARPVPLLILGVGCLAENPGPPPLHLRPNRAIGAPEFCPASDVERAIRDSAPDPALIRSTLARLEALSPEGNEDFNAVKTLVDRALEGESENDELLLRVFLNAPRSLISQAEENKITREEVCKRVRAVLEKGIARRTQSPLIVVGGPPFRPERTRIGIGPGMPMSAVEDCFDVLCRKSSAPARVGVLIPGAFSEVDLACLLSQRGIPTVRVTATPDGLVVTGGDDSGEKVFAIGHQAALRFGGALSTTGGERLFALLLPKGFLRRFGVDLRTAGEGGRSAQTPTTEDFHNGFVINNPQAPVEKQHCVPIPDTAAFAVRAEDATPEGQVHIHFTRTNMVILDQPMSQVEFFRQNTIGVVEFGTDGNVIQVVFFE